MSLAACAGEKGSPLLDSTDTSAGAGVSPWAVVYGASGDALGNALRGGEDLDGDGDADLGVAGFLGGRVCAVFGPVPAGARTLDESGAACLTGEYKTDYAGYGMTVAPDLSGDGAAELLVGAIGSAEAGANAGKAYLVSGPLSAGSQAVADAAQSTWLGEAIGDYAGIGLEGAGDLTGDGQPDLVLGSSGYDGEEGGGGRAYVLAGPIGAGAQSLADAFASITGLGAPATDTAAMAAQPAPPPHGSFGTGDFVGESMAGERDLDGDGQADLALGATGDQQGGLNAGKVAIFHGPLAGGALSVEQADRTLLGDTEGAYAGSPVRGAPDLDGDGTEDLLVAADALGAGQVYLISSGVTETISSATLRFEGSEDGDLFGFALSSAADLDGDGAPDLAIAAPLARTDELETGGVWVFFGPFSSGVLAASTGLALPGAVESGSFGSAVDLAGDLDGDGLCDLAVGARNDQSNGSFAGAVYLFNLGGTP